MEKSPALGSVLGLLPNHWFVERAAICSSTPSMLVRIHLCLQPFSQFHLNIDIGVVYFQNMQFFFLP